MPTNSNKTSNFNKIKNEFRNSFSRVQKPDINPTMPEQLSSLSGDKLSELQTHYSVWREYTEDLLIDALVDSTAAQQEYEHAYNVAFLSVEGKTKEEREIKASIRPEVRLLEEKSVQAQLIHDLIQKKLESFEKTLAVISREITRRQNNSFRT